MIEFVFASEQSDCSRATAHSEVIHMPDKRGNRKLTHCENFGSDECRGFHKGKPGRDVNADISATRRK